MSMGGDGDDDDTAATVLWGLDRMGTWGPACWTKSPEQMVSEARSANQSAHAMAAAAACRRDDPPQHTAERPF